MTRIQLFWLNQMIKIKFFWLRPQVKIWKSSQVKIWNPIQWKYETHSNLKWTKYERNPRSIQWKIWSQNMKSSQVKIWNLISKNKLKSNQNTRTNTFHHQWISPWKSALFCFKNYALFQVISQNLTMKKWFIFDFIWLHYIQVLTSFFHSN